MWVISMKKRERHREKKADKQLPTSCTYINKSLIHSFAIYWSVYEFTETTVTRNILASDNNVFIFILYSKYAQFS